MNIISKKFKKSKNTVQNQDNSISEQQQDQSSLKLNKNEWSFTQLQQSLTKLNKFIQETNQLNILEFRSDILQYLKERNYIFQYLTPQEILSKVQIRIDKMIKTKRLKKNWGEDDLKILIWVVSIYCEKNQIFSVQNLLNQKDWNNIAELIPGATGQSCMFKWLSLKKITLSQYNWLPQQSELLQKLIKKYYGQNVPSVSQIKIWKKLSHELYYQNKIQTKVYRSAKQCRQHWSCYLSPSIKKGPWQPYEDANLLSYIISQNGEKKWSQIAKKINGRTQNAIKNRYTLIIDKLRKQPKFKNKKQFDLINIYLSKIENGKKNQKDKLNIQKKTSIQPVEEQINTNEGENTKQVDTNKQIIKVQQFNLSHFAVLSKYINNIKPGVINNGTLKIFSDQNFIEQVKKMQMNNIQCLLNKNQQQINKKY